MRLDEWMSQKGLKPPSLATAINKELKTNFSKTSIYRIAAGHHPSLELAVAITFFTEGEVSPYELLSRGAVVEALQGAPLENVVFDKKDIGVAEEDFSDLFDEL